MKRAVEALGRTALQCVESLGAIARFAGQIARVMVLRPWRFRSLVRQTYDAGVLSLLIVCAAGLTVGMVLALQGYNTLVRFGAES